MKEWFHRNRAILSEICLFLAGIFQIVRYSLGDISQAAVVFWILYTLFILFLILKSFLRKPKGKTLKKTLMRLI